MLAALPQGKHWTVEDLIDPRLVNGFRFVKRHNGTNFQGYVSRRVAPGDGPGTRVTEFCGLDRSTPEEAAQDSCDYFNGLTPEPALRAVPSPFQETTVERTLTEKATFAARESEVEREYERTHALMVRDLAAYLTGLGHDVISFRVAPEGENSRPADVFDKTTSTLFEVKRDGHREFWTAIGQAKWYRANSDYPYCNIVILVPSRPVDSLLALAAAEGIVVWWPNTVGGYAFS